MVWMFCCKTFRSRHHFVVAICDKELIGKEIRKNPKFRVEKDFYFEKYIGERKALELMRRATIGNLVGKRIIKLALKKKFISEENVMFIGDVPHAQFIQ